MRTDRLAPVIDIAELRRHRRAFIANALAEIRYACREMKVSADWLAICHSGGRSLT